MRFVIASFRVLVILAWTFDGSTVKAEVVADNPTAKRDNEERTGSIWSSLPDAWKVLHIDEWIREQLNLEGALGYGGIEKQTGKLIIHKNPVPWPRGSRTRGHPIGRDQVVNILPQSGRVQKRIELLHALRRYSADKSYADKMQSRLLAKRPEYSPQMAITWLRSGVSPDEVYKMMPIGAEESLMDYVTTTDDVDVLVHALLQWDAYVDLYRYFGYAYSFEAEMKRMENYRKFISSYRPPLRPMMA
uniref:Uncharacterized protein n=1 Tax=Peronospora matthiolae TaxID=2874970 RepID=A0AAV1UM80_9STRA